MRKNNLFFVGILCALFLLIQTGSVFSQELQTVNKLGLGINGLDYSIEIPLSSKITIEPSGGFGPSYGFDHDESVAGRMNWGWALVEPSGHIGVYTKYIYNRDRRKRKGKSMLYNSGHFLGVKLKYVSKPLTEKRDMLNKNNTLLVNLNWGGQHSLGSHWIWSYSVGAGYGRNLDYSYGAFYPALDLKIAYVIAY